MTKLAVVSGGGTGIGAATARVLAADGYAVTILGRRPDVLAATVQAIAAEVGPPVRSARSPPIFPSRQTYAGPPSRWRAGRSTSWSTPPAGTSAGRRARIWARSPTGGGRTSTRPADRRPAHRGPAAGAAPPRRPGHPDQLDRGQRGNGGPYSAAKAALHGYLYDLAAELSPDGITANIVSPGYVADTEFFGGRMTAEGHARRVAQTLVGRAGQPAEIAALIRYLASPAAGFVTGQILNINGGALLGH